LALQVADLYLKESFVKESKDNKEVKPKIEHMKLTNNQLKKFSGQYWNEAGSYARKIYVKNNTLMYFRNEGNESVLMPISQNEFQMMDVGVDLKVKFKKSKNKHQMIIVIDNGQSIVSDEFAPINLDAKYLMQFTGTFYSSELTTYYHFIIKDEKLVATHARASDIDLKPLKVDKFSASYSLIDFNRNDKNDITGFRISSGRVKNLLFKKLK